MIERNIAYADRSATKNLLDVIFDPDQKNLPVLFFIHGGSWMTGSKDMYTKLGENFLAKGFVSVIINYRLFPSTNIFGMVQDCRDAFEWSKNNITKYGGDAESIYLMGHSAGGHLAAVTGMSETMPKKNVAGFILVDAFGLSAYHFLSEHSQLIPEFLAEIFGLDNKRWAAVSPDQLIKAQLPPYLILTGEATYPFVTLDNQLFATALKSSRVMCEHKIIQRMSHMQMIYMFENTAHSIYSEIAEWMKKEEII